MTGTNKTYRCPECGELLSTPKMKGSGYKCGTDGCDVCKVYFDDRWRVTRIFRSSVPRRSVQSVTQRMSDLLLVMRGDVLPEVLM